MKRRSFLAASAAATLAKPALAQSAKPLVFVPQGNLVTMDAVWTTATTTRNAANMVYETLYGRDAKMNPKPQMVEGAVVEEDASIADSVLLPGARVAASASVEGKAVLKELRVAGKSGYVCTFTDASLVGKPPAKDNYKTLTSCFVYLGDNGRFPYGPRPLDEIRAFALEIGRYF